MFEMKDGSSYVFIGSHAVIIWSKLAIISESLILKKTIFKKKLRK